MQQVTLNLYISADEYLKLYRGQAHYASARALDGRKVRFPAHILKPYVTHEGIRGLFEICFDGQGKFLSIRRLHST